MADQLDLHRTKGADHELFKEVRQRLYAARVDTIQAGVRDLSEADVTLVGTSFRDQAVAVLGRAGLSGQFDIAVENLRGPGLETPTNLTDARYGAANLVLAIGMLS